MHIAIRVDASIQMGSGHVMRCLALANDLREQGSDITFICREQPGHLIALIESLGYGLLRLPFVAGTPHGNLAHSHWLGATQAEDARQTLEALKPLGHMHCLVIDHYALDADWEAAMRSITERILVIDDLADRVHDCDVLLDQNLHLADMNNRYEKLVPPHSNILQGPKYALLRPEFKRVAANQKMRDGVVQRIFVFFGGSDPTNETGKALRAIKKLGRKDVAIDVVVGSANLQQEEISSFCAQLENTRFHKQVNNIAELMSAADIAIGAGGGTMWERCCLGLPTIVVSVAENQQSACEALARLGPILYLGRYEHVGVDLLEAALRVAMATPDLLRGMGEKCASIVDGQGVKRVVRQLIEPDIVLRKATLADCEPMFNWRNAEETRKFSITKALISTEEHRVWFGKSLENADRQLLIGESDQHAVGVLRFDRDGNRAVISVYLIPGNYGKGIGGRLIEQGSAWVMRHWSEINSIEAVIMDENESSIAAFTKAGFERFSSNYVKKIGN